MKKLGLCILVVAAGSCGSNKITQQTGAAACITATACGIIIGGVSACTNAVANINDPDVQAAIHISPSEVTCIAGAGNNCTKAKECLAGDMPPATCTGSSTSCNGTVWQSCNALVGSGGNEGVQLFDCASVHQMCLTNNGNTDCGYGTCAGAAPTCMGSLVQTCDNGIVKQTDCSRIDATCNPSGVFGAHCRGNGPACSSPKAGDATLRCDGSVLVVCDDGQEARQDCAQDNLGCFPNVGGKDFGCAAGNQCDPQTAGATCVGTKLTFCNRGLTQTADCADAGFTTCNPNNGGSCQP